LKRVEEIRQGLVEFWQCTNTNAIFVFPRFASSAARQFILGELVKRLLYAYFIGNLSAKNVKIRSCVISYSKPKVGRF